MHVDTEWYVRCLLTSAWCCGRQKILLNPESSIAVSSVVAVNMIGVQSKVNTN
jgi:hypothetical protein